MICSHIFIGICIRKGKILKSSFYFLKAARQTHTCQLTYVLLGRIKGNSQHAYG